MAQQIAGLCFLEGTFDQLTFYKMDGKYYCRVKSSLTSKRVKTAPEFRWTMALARLMGRASKIGSAIYQALPPSWRQFWMYRSFTGEAYTMLLHSTLTDEDVKQILWKTYVEYWEQWEAANTNNPALPIIKAPKQQKIRKRRVYSLESIQRMKDRYGKPKWRNPEEEEKKRQKKALNDAAWQRTLDREKQEAELKAKEALLKETEEKAQAAEAIMKAETVVAATPTVVEVPPNAADVETNCRETQAAVQQVQQWLDTLTTATVT
jgi:hypothetical protein